MSKKSVYIAYTGGTIGMRRTSDGYAPAAGYLEEQMRRMPQLAHDEIPDYVIHEYQPLRDSASMTPRDWLAIAHDIASHYDAFDGFVVLHGTDTMAYTASALSFLLGALRKPVLVSGSQIPLCELRNDARENLIGALQLACDPELPEVCLYFGSKLLRGNRSVKVNAVGLDAFDSPNYPALGEIGVEVEVSRQLLLPPAPAGHSLIVPEIASPVVGALRLFPGLSPSMLRNLLRQPLQGLVLETYGVGNGPDDPEFLKLLARAVRRGIVIVNCTQCLKGAVHPEEYAAGSELTRRGVVAAGDMTVEAALTKLYCLLGEGRDPEQVRARMAWNLRGELTPAD